MFTTETLTTLIARTHTSAEGCAATGEADAVTGLCARCAKADRAVERAITRLTSTVGFLRSWNRFGTAMAVKVQTSARLSYNMINMMRLCVIAHEDALVEFVNAQKRAC
jgi:hypothetical protein